MVLFFTTTCPVMGLLFSKDFLEAVFLIGSLTVLVIFLEDFFCFDLSCVLCIDKSEAFDGGRELSDPDFVGIIFLPTDPGEAGTFAASALFRRVLNFSTRPAVSISFSLPV